MKVTEQQVAAAVVRYVELCGHDVYQEVEVGSGVADIVALVGASRSVWTIEVKTSWSLDLLEQCVARRRCSDRVFAAVPRSRVDHTHLFRKLGIGTLIVNPGAPERHLVNVGWFPDRVPKSERWGQSLRDVVKPGHKTHAKAGAPSAGGRYTTFRETADQLAAAVAKKPGMSALEAIKAIDHHYASNSSARQHLIALVGLGKVPGVRVVRRGTVMELHPVEAR